MRSGAGRRTTGKQTGEKIIGRCIGGILVAAALAALLLLLFALLLKWEWLKEDSITLGNTIIKMIGAVVSGCIASQKVRKRRAVVSAVCGIGFILFSFALCAIVEKSWTVSLLLLSDLGLAAVSALGARILWDVFLEKK